MEDGFKKLNDELTKSLEKSLEKSLTATNDGIKDLRSWVRWIVGTFGVGVRCQWILLHNSRLTTRLDYVENRFLRPLHGGKVGDKDQRFGDEAYNDDQKYGGGDQRFGDEAYNDDPKCYNSA